MVFCIIIGSITSHMDHVCRNIRKPTADHFVITALKLIRGWSTVQKKTRHFASHVDILPWRGAARVLMFSVLPDFKTVTKNRGFDKTACVAGPAYRQYVTVKSVVCQLSEVNSRQATQKQMQV